MKKEAERLPTPSEMKPSQPNNLRTRVRADKLILAELERGQSQRNNEVLVHNYPTFASLLWLQEMPDCS